MDPLQVMSSQVQTVQWKTYERKRKMLRRLGFDPDRSSTQGYVIACKRSWRQSKVMSVCIAMDNAYWEGGLQVLQGGEESWPRSKLRTA